MAQPDRPLSDAGIEAAAGAIFDAYYGQSGAINAKVLAHAAVTAYLAATPLQDGPSDEH
jgi:hypothetical protein